MSEAANPPPVPAAVEGWAAHTPGPWEYVPGNEHHGPYVTSEFGTTVADCYTMSKPAPWSSDEPRPVPFMAELSEPNARLIAAAPDLYEALSTTRALVSEFAASGFTDEDAAKRLFLNQAKITAALTRARQGSGQ